MEGRVCFGACKRQWQIKLSALPEADENETRPYPMIIAQMF